MTMHWAPITPMDYFTSLVASDDGFPLLEAAASLAQDDYPDLNLQQVLNDVDQLLARLRRRLPADAGVVQRLQVLNQMLYQDLGFGPNFNNYSDPDNSYVHRVLAERRAIPVTMAVIWLELARGIGLRAYGVPFPGHFMLKVPVPEGLMVIDPLTGRSLSRETLLEQLETFVGPMDSNQSLSYFLNQHLHGASPRVIIARMLRNLKEIHMAEEDWPRLLAVQDRLLVLLPQAWAEYRDRGMALAEVGIWDRALLDLETYLERAGAVEDRLAIAERAAALRRIAY
jgi:regulator of sirC expression with transglutaminase-like and TPR domain